MLITIAAVGKLKAGPERELFDRFFSRAGTTGRRLSLTFAHREFPESRASPAATRRDQEAAAMLTALPADATVVALDESGKNGGAADIVFAIGGADGHGAALIDKAALRLAFGAMTWPHQLVRLMLAEQCYRAVTILSGHPYHRD
jgi:23S rRNA (pseudouridine1915-N3)-methyltransferase